MCDPAPEIRYPVEVTVIARDATNREARQDFEFMSKHPNPVEAIHEIAQAVNVYPPGRLKFVKADE